MDKYKYFTSNITLIIILFISIFIFAGCSKDIENNLNESVTSETSSISQAPKTTQIEETSMQESAVSETSSLPEETVAETIPVTEASAETTAVETTATATTTATAETTAAASAIQIIIANDVFQPNKTTIKIGGTVTWINNDGYAHTVASNSGVFNSGIITNGGQFSFTFNTEGVYDYICEIHPNMKGTITVVK